MNVPAAYKETVESDKGSRSQLSAISFLSDGGIWNNLATEPFADNFALRAGGRRFLYGPWDIVIADASGAVGSIKPTQLRVPGWSELKVSVRRASIQNTNTVTPRRISFDDDLFLELRQPSVLKTVRERLYCVVSCAETPMKILERSGRNFEVPDVFKYKGVGPGIPERYANVAHRIKELGSNLQSLDKLDKLETIAATPNCKKAGQDTLALYPTTLGRVRKPIALGLVSRGYANASVTLYLTNLSQALSVPEGWLAGLTGDVGRGRVTTRSD